MRDIEEKKTAYNLWIQIDEIDSVRLLHVLIIIIIDITRLSYVTFNFITNWPKFYTIVIRICVTCILSWVRERLFVRWLSFACKVQYCTCGFIRFYDVQILKFLTSFHLPHSSHVRPAVQPHVCFISDGSRKSKYEIEKNFVYFKQNQAIVHPLPDRRQNNVFASVVWVIDWDVGVTSDVLLFREDRWAALSSDTQTDVFAAALLFFVWHVAVLSAFGEFVHAAHAVCAVSCGR